MFSALRLGDAAALQTALDDGADVRAFTEAAVPTKPWTALELAVTAERNAPEMMRLLLERNAPVRNERIDGRPALIVAAANKRLAEIEMLIGLGVDVNAASDEGTTALISVADEMAEPHIDHAPEVVAFLLRLGADVNAAENTGTTALMKAARWGHASVVRMLLEAGARAAAVDATNGSNALHHAVQRWHGGTDVVTALIAGGCPVDTPNQDGMTPLFLAVMNNNGPAARALADSGAQIDCPNGKGVTVERMVESIEDFVFRHLGDGSDAVAVVRAERARLDRRALQAAAEDPPSGTAARMGRRL